MQSTITWIRCSERLPEDCHDDCLTTDGENVSVDLHARDGVWVDYLGYEYPVTHWAELPAPPSTETDASRQRKSALQDPRVQQFVAKIAFENEAMRLMREGMPAPPEGE